MMKVIKEKRFNIVLLLLLAILAIGVVDGYGQTQCNVDTAIENKVYQKVYSLKEVKTYEKAIDSIFAGKQEMIVVIRSSTKKNTPYYWVQVGTNDGIRFTAKYNFYVYVPKMEVKYYDTINDKILSLKEWRSLIK